MSSKLQLISTGFLIGIGIMVLMSAVSHFDPDTFDATANEVEQADRPPQFLQNLSWMCQEEDRLARRVMLDAVDRLSKRKALSYFAQIIYAPLRLSCTALMPIGGHVWNGKCFDGHKYVCLDDFVDPKEKCLVYSFGIAENIAFEEGMTKLGCEVFGYDKAMTNVMAANQHPQMTFRKAEINMNSPTSQSFSELLKANQHSETPIRYLKVDIEGAERPGLRQWIKSGALNHVQQLGVEFHNVEDNVREYWKILQGLYQLGFKLISYDSNYCTAQQSLIYECIEVVFRKTSVCSATTHTNL